MLHLPDAIPAPAPGSPAWPAVDVLETAPVARAVAGKTAEAGEAEALVYDLKALGVAPAEIQDALARMPELSRDPAHGGQSTPSIRREALAGLGAWLGGVLEGPLTREPTGHSEFIDGKGRLWDAKSPVSPRPGEAWEFPAEHVAQKVASEVDGGEGVILDLSLTSPADRKTLMEALARVTTPEQRASVVAVCLPEVV